MKEIILPITDLFNILSIHVVPEQFTVKAHPVLFQEGEGMGWGAKKKEALLFQSTIDIHIQNARKTQKDAYISNGVSRFIGKGRGGVGRGGGWGGEVGRRKPKKGGTIIIVYNCIVHVWCKSRCNLLSVATKLQRLAFCAFILN